MDTTYDILDVEATVKMLTDRYSQTNRLYGNTDKQIIIINTKASCLCNPLNKTV